MRDGVFEENEIHGRVEFVVVVQSLLQKPAQLRVIDDWQVLGVAYAGREVTVEQRLAEDELVVVVFEAMLDGVVLDLVEEFDVASFHQFVTIHSIALVNPQSNELDGVLAAIRRRKQQPLGQNTPDPGIK